MKLIGADEVARRARAAVGYSGMEAKEFEHKLADRGVVTPSNFRRMIARSNPRGARSVEELWDIADLAGVPRSFMEDGFSPPSRDELSELQQAVRAVAAAVSLEGLEEGQRHFLEDWLRRTPSQDAEGARENSTQGEG